MTDHPSDDHGKHPRLDELRASIATGEVDTLMVAFTDMQGRLMGKRVTARPSSMVSSTTAPTCAPTSWARTWR